MSYVELKNLSFEDKLAKLDNLIDEFMTLELEYPQAGFDKSVRQLQTKRAEITNTIGRKVQFNRMVIVDNVIENPCQEISLMDSIFYQWKRKGPHNLKDTPIDWSK